MGGGSKQMGKYLVLAAIAVAILVAGLIIRRSSAAVQRVWLKYGGIVVIVLAIAMLADGIYRGNSHYFSDSLMRFALLFITGVLSLRKAKSLNHN